MLKNARTIRSLALVLCAAVLAVAVVMAGCASGSTSATGETKSDAIVARRIVRSLDSIDSFPWPDKTHVGGKIVTLWYRRSLDNSLAKEVAEEVGATLDDLVGEPDWTLEIRDLKSDSVRHRLPLCSRTLEGESYGADGLTFTIPEGWSHRLSGENMSVLSAEGPPATLYVGIGEIGPSEHTRIEVEFYASQSEAQESSRLLQRFRSRNGWVEEPVVTFEANGFQGQARRVTFTDGKTPRTEVELIVTSDSGSACRVLRNDYGKDSIGTASEDLELLAEETVRLLAIRTSAST